MTSDVPTEAMKAAVAYVSDEYNKEVQRKAGLETRAFAIGTADFAMVTLFGVWIDRLSLLDDLAGCYIAKWVCIVALGLALIALGLAVVAAVCFRFQAPDPNGMSDFLDDVFGSTADQRDTFDEIGRTYLGQLRAARAANRAKFWCLAWAAMVLGAATFAAAIALLAVGA